MSRFLPIENLVYRTTLTKDQIINKLNETAEPRKDAISFSAQSYSKPYAGKITGNKFEISRVINYKNSFNPIIKGEISSDHTVTIIRVTMKSHDIVFAFMMVWIGALSLASLLTTYTLITQPFEAHPLMPFAMLIFGVVLFVGGFKKESITSKNNLQKIFEAEVEE